MAEGNGGGGLFNGGPWWLKALETLGPTTVIAIGLVYWLTMTLTPILQNMNDFMDKHSLQMQQVIKDEEAEGVIQADQWLEIRRLQAEQHQDKEASLKLEQQTCVNTAKSLYQSQQCLAIRNDGEQIGQ